MQIPVPRVCDNKTGFDENIPDLFLSLQCTAVDYYDTYY